MRTFISAPFLHVHMSYGWTIFIFWTGMVVGCGAPSNQTHHSQFNDRC